MTSQRQSGGDGSTNIQAGSVTVTQGVSLAEVRTIALDVFRVNFLELSGQAMMIARERAEEITEQFLKELEKQHPDGLGQAPDPDFQYGLFTVQREYARSGDKELGDLLVDLLVDRTKHSTRSILQIVLNESLAVAPKLTADQLAILSVVFVYKYTANHGLNCVDSLGEHFDRYVEPFLPSLTKRMASYQHLEYSGCGNVGIGSVSFPSILLHTYPGLLSKGFTPETLAERAQSIPPDSPLLMPCMHDAANLQVNALDEEGFRKRAVELGAAVEDADALWALSNEHLMSEAETKETAIGLRPYMADLLDVWEDSSMKSLTLTSVGIAIGHANVKRSAGEFTDLAIWIN